MQETLPMHGRMIHGTRGEDQYQESQNYDTFGRVCDTESRDYKADRASAYTPSTEQA